MAKRIGRYTVMTECEPAIVGFGSVASKKEGEGPLKEYFDLVEQDTTFGQQSWEQAESMIQKNAVQIALKKAGMSPDQIDVICAGDLLNQCIGSTFGLSKLEIPFVGMYGACSTMAESLATATMFLETGAVDTAVAVTSSHFCSSERQFRFPLEYGSLRTPTSQWTVTGGGAVVLKKGEKGAKIRHLTFGKIFDYGIKDANNMGAAMAPAAADTIKAFFSDTDTTPEDYDGIFTGDLGSVGSELLCQLLEKDGIDIRDIHRDCGVMIFTPDMQDVHAGGSGCGCSASVLNSFILKEMQKGRYKNILFVATGALMSPTSSMQGENIPSVAHLVNIVGD